MSSKSILLHFYDREDFFQGIEVLQHYQVPICELYIPRRVVGIESKLQIKKMGLGYSVIKYGCLGGIALSSLGYCLLANNVNLFNRQSLISIFLNLFMVASAFFFARRLFPWTAPKLMRLKGNDNRYLLVIDADSVVANEELTGLFKYARAVEISPAVKNMIIA